MEKTGCACVADDSGLEVAAFHGASGQTALFIINIPKIEVVQVKDGAKLKVTTQPMHVYYRNDKLQSVERGTTTTNQEYLRVKYIPSNYSTTSDFLRINNRFKN